MTLSAPELLTDAHDVSAFACGRPALDHWLKARALSNQRKGFTVDDPGLGVLTAEPGVGKTAALRNLCAELPNPDHLVV